VKDETRLPTLSPHIQCSLEISSQSNKKGRRNKRNTIKGRSQTIPICRKHDFILKRPEKFLDTINFDFVAGYKINSQKSAAFLYTNNEHIEEEYRETIPFLMA
jgi:hypothetical protein